LELYSFSPHGEGGFKMIIKVLGSGCANCHKLEENVKKALAEKGLEAEVVKVTDFKEILKYGVMKTPALVLDEKLKVSGRVAEVKEILNWL
jgi:small redox-active disulfide protein 2